MQHTHTHLTPFHTPSPMLTARPLIAPYSASHTAITPKLYLWLPDRSEGQNLQFHANPPSHPSCASTLRFSVSVRAVATVVSLHIIIRLMRWLLKGAFRPCQSLKRGKSMLSQRSQRCSILLGSHDLITMSSLVSLLSGGLEMLIMNQTRSKQDKTERDKAHLERTVCVVTLCREAGEPVLHFIGSSDCK